MKMHAIARLSLKGRELLVDRVESAGWSPMTGAEIAETLDMALSTVSGILTRIGLGKLGRLGPEPAQRYERARPGELIHIDVKKLGRIARPGYTMLGGRSARGAAGYHRQSTKLGWQFVHIAIDDATRLAYVEVLADEKALTAIGFLRRAVKHFAAYGITVERLITDNGSAYRSTIHAIACDALGIRHSATPATAPRSPTSTANTSTESSTNKPTQTPSTRRSQPPKLTPGIRGVRELQAFDHRADVRDRGSVGSGGPSEKCA
jgi:Integrase core domain